MHGPAGDTADRNDPVIRHIAESANRGNPNSPATIPKKRSHAVFCRSAPGDRAHRWRSAPGLRVLAVRDRLAATPPFQAIECPDPHASILVGQNRSASGVRHTLVPGKGGDGKLAKAVEPPVGSDPKV